MDAGSGDDIVDTTAIRAATRVTLGAGKDELAGGSGGHIVVAGPAEDADAEADTVRALDGYDVVDTGQSGLVDTDHVDIGGGSGAIVVHSERDTGILRAADDQVSASLRMPPLAAGRWVID